MQVYRHRENQLFSRAKELEETITHQNKKLISMSQKPGGKDQVFKFVFFFYVKVYSSPKY
jgi:hypothetical protein